MLRVYAKFGILVKSLLNIIVQDCVFLFIILSYYAAEMKL